MRAIFIHVGAMTIQGVNIMSDGHNVNIVSAKVEGSSIGNLEIMLGRVHIVLICHPLRG
jgi:hypothetical protein